MRIIFFSCKKSQRETAEVGGEAWKPVIERPSSSWLSLEEGFMAIYHLTPGKPNRALGEKQKIHPPGLLCGGENLI